MRIDVKRNNTILTFEEINNLLYGKKTDDEYSCFIDRHYISYNTIPQNYPRHSKLGELIKI